MSYFINPLHPPVMDNSRSPLSSISSAVPLGCPPCQSHPSVTRRRVPQPAYVLGSTSQWRASMGRNMQTQDPIFFGYSGQGVPMRKLYSSSLSPMLQDANGAVFLSPGRTSITFRILWPGYDHVEWARPIGTYSSQGPITRAQLALAIAKNYAYYFEKMQYEATRSSEWRVGPAGIRFENLVLISLWNVFGDSWQADVAVDM